jgi:hypothetical protein
MQVKARFRSRLALVCKPLVSTVAVGVIVLGYDRFEMKLMQSETIVKTREKKNR